MEQTQAASSAAEDVFRGESVSFDEFSRYRADGTLPERFKPAEPAAESAPADAPEETVESAPEKGESDPDSETEVEDQEPPQKGSGAEKRIKQLLARTKELERRLDEAAKQGAKPDSPPAQPQQAQQQPPQNYQEWRKAFKPAEWVSQYIKDNPEASYEDANATMADYLADVRDGFKSREQAFAEQKRKWDAQISEAAQRYEDFESVKGEFAAKVVADQQIPLAIKEMLNDSDVLPDLVHAIASDPAELAKFVALAKNSPTKAARYIAAKEAEIEAKLPTGSAVPRNEKGQFTGKEPDSGKAPEKRQTQAPRPPTPVSGGSSRGFDVSDESLSPEEWMRKRNQQIRSR